MDLIKGNSALSDFRLQKYWETIGVEAGTEPQIEARYFYCVWFKDDCPTTSEHLAKLKDLIGVRDSNKRSGKNPILFVTPRVGTTSPWSSKAEEICKNSGINSIDRLERVIAWYTNPNTQFDTQ